MYRGGLFWCCSSDLPALHCTCSYLPILSSEHLEHVTRQCCQGPQSQAHQPETFTTRHPRRRGAGYPGEGHHRRRRSAALHPQITYCPSERQESRRTALKQLEGLWCPTLDFEYAIVFPASTGRGVRPLVPYNTYPLYIPVLSRSCVPLNTTVFELLGQ